MTIDAHATPGAPEGDPALALAGLLRQATAASLDPTAVLEVVVRWCSSVLGDQATVRILSADGGRLLPGPFSHCDPATEETLTETAIAPRPLDADPVAAEVLRTGQPVLDHTASDDGGASSLLMVPLRSRGRSLGTLTLTRGRGRPPYTEADRDLCLDMGDRIGLIFDNARLYDRVRMQAITLEHVDAAVVGLDANGMVNSWNPAATRMFGWTEEETLGRPPLALLSAEPPERLAEVQAAVEADGRHATDWQLRRRDGSVFEGHIDAVAVEDAGGVVCGLVALFHDLGERLRLIRALERRAAQQSAVAELGERALEAEDPSRLLAQAVDAVQALLDVELAAVFELVDDGRRLRLRAGAGFRADDVRDATVPAGWQESQEGFTLIRREPVIVVDTCAERRFEQAELIRRHQARSGVTVIVQGRAGPHAVLSAHSARPGAFSPEDVAFLQSMANVLGDALDRWRNEEEIRRRGLHDALTELPNRALVMDRLAQALARTDRRPGQIALIFLDLDHFKVINDSLGHTAGDVVLREAAHRLRMAVRPGDTVGRFGGDEFVVLCEEVEGEAMALAIAERLVDAFSQPFAIADDRHSVGVSIGVALYDRSGDAETLLRDADAAMYRAKDRGRGRVEVFDTGMRARAAGRLQVEAALRQALDSSELAVLYQPVVDLADGSLAAIEALVRWNHPTDGFLTPDAFIPIAEESGLIVPLGRRVLELACMQAARWARAYPSRPLLTVHVNLSPRQLNDQALVESIAATMAATGAPPGSLTLEITESTLIDRGPAKLRLLERLRELGVDLMLDDFGTGWSSLGYLAQLPIGGLKIDRSFVAAISGEHAPIVDAVVRLARAFDLRVVAEGVEQEEQLAVLRAMGCELAQGFLFARPMAAEQIDELLLAGETPFATERAAALSRPRGAGDHA